MNSASYNNICNTRCSPGGVLYEVPGAVRVLVFLLTEQSHRRQPGYFFVFMAMQSEMTAPTNKEMFADKNQPIARLYIRNMFVVVQYLFVLLFRSLAKQVTALATIE